MGKTLLICGIVVLVLWLTVALLMAYRWIWSRRHSMNASMAAAHQIFGERFQPAGRLRWAWILVQGIPLLLLFSFILLVDFGVRLLIGAYCWVTGRPLPVQQADDGIDNPPA